MAAPAPAVPLAFQTAAIYQNAVFAFQPDAFQSINLTQGAQWTQLPMGVSVNGSQAVLAQADGQDALFIVGGRSNASESSFPGFQKYVFSSNSWNQLQPQTSVAQNRVQHGAVFLQSTNSILIYGGSQDNSYTATSETYTIGASDPYVMKSYPAGAPAVQNPILVPFNASHALLAGGGANQDEIWTFSEADGWVMMTTTIPGGVGDPSSVQGAVVTDSNNNKQLDLFNMGASPNTVRTVSLSGQFHKRSHIMAHVGRRGSSAPTATRSGFSLAQSSSQVVICGGTNDASAGPMAVYDTVSGNWMNNEAIFGSSTGSSAFKAGDTSSASAPSSAASQASSISATATSPSTTSAASSTAPSAAASTTVSAAGGAPANNSVAPGHADTTTIVLAAVLGSVFGLAALGIIAYIIFRYRRSKAQSQRPPADDAALDEKRADSPASSIGTIPGRPYPFERGQTPTISKPTLMPRNDAADLSSPRALGTDEGWNRYLANNNTVENLYPGSTSAPDAASAGAAVSVAAATYNSTHQRDTQYTAPSEYTVDNARASHGAAYSSFPTSAYEHAHARGASTDTHDDDYHAALYAANAPTAHAWDPTAHTSFRPASSVYQDRASSLYPPSSSLQAPLDQELVDSFPTASRPDTREDLGRPVTRGKEEEGGHDKGMRSIIHRNFARPNVDSMVSVASDDGPDPDAGFVFPESAARRVSPGSLPRSAGNATGRTDGGDLSWLKFDQR